MRLTVTVCLAAVSMLGSVAGRAAADTKAELVSTAMIWDRATRNTNPDLIRFKDRWFLACQENAVAGWTGGELRILTSKDGKTWEAVALLKSPTPKRGLYAPTFAHGPDGRLMVSAGGFLPYPDSDDPLPEYGGLYKTFAWYSKDGRDWGKHRPVGRDNFTLGRVVWHKGAAFSHAIGRICGIAQTIHVMASKDGKAFESRYEETLREFMPYDGEFLFEGDTAYCLMTTGHRNAGLLGTAKAPYEAWEWKKLGQRVRHPRFIRLPDKRVLATVGLFDGKARTSLCEFHPATGKFTELLELPTGGQSVTAGLAWHDGHLWVSYPAQEKDRVRVHLAKVKLK